MDRLSGIRIVEKAREYVGTPFHQDARSKGVGIDCVGLLVCTLKELGMEIADVRGYGSARDDFEFLQQKIVAYCRKLEPIEDLSNGDILLFRGRLMYNHCGFFASPENMIHAYSSPGFRQVVEHRIDEGWQSRLVARYRLTELN